MYSCFSPNEWNMFEKYDDCFDDGKNLQGKIVFSERYVYIQVHERQRNCF
jgi:hypothetical protein